MSPTILLHFISLRSRTLILLHLKGNLPTHTHYILSDSSEEVLTNLKNGSVNPSLLITDTSEASQNLVEYFRANNPLVPILVISTKSSAEKARRLMENGANDHHPMTTSTKELVLKVRQLLGIRPLHVLILDSLPGKTQYLQGLVDQTFNLWTTSTFSFISQSLDSKTPDLVLVNIRPGMINNGCQVVRLIRGLTDDKVHIIAVIPHDHTSVERGLVLTALGYDPDKQGDVEPCIASPIKPSEFKAHLELIWSR